MEQTTAPKLDVRTEILDAAERRFQHYGYGKTTMAEIASDNGMSAANLYRYFENKHDIACACANRCLGERIELLRAVVRQPGLGAGARLLEFALTGLRYTHEQTSEHPKLHELVENVCQGNPDLVHDKMAAEQSLIAEILAQGNDSGEFAVVDVVATAQAVSVALTAFKLPITVALYPLHVLEQRAHSVVALLAQGLAKR